MPRGRARTLARWLLPLCALLLCCGGSGVATRSFEPTRALFPNPERGLADAVDLIADRDYSYVRRRGRSLAIDRVQLDDFRDRPLDAAFLERLGEGLERARDHGIKIVLRFAYNSGPYPNPEPDASLARILTHIGQLTPILRENDDVIAVVQAGFIGAWGEWHSSTHGLDAREPRRAVLRALLKAVPPNRMIQVRKPMFKAEIVGGPITESEAYTDAPVARVGHHNDCFLSGEREGGTYGDPVEEWKRFVARDGRFTPIGGDTCRPDPPRTDCKATLAALERQHWSFLNGIWHPAVLRLWKAEGCLDEIRRRLGYRFELTEASWTRRVGPGERLAVELALKNTGFASPYNPRPVFLVLEGPGGRLAARIRDADPRRWKPGDKTRLSASLQVPEDAEPGRYRLLLWLPDADPELAKMPAFSIRLANRGVWDREAGANVLSEDVVVEPRARERR